MEVECVGVEEERRLTQLRFDAAVKVIKSLPPDGPFQPSNDMMLKFYSYYKQATIGECDIPRPGFWDAVGKAKWDAWNNLGDMSREEAMAAYVDEMKLILEGMPVTDEVEELLRILGPFYELVDEKKRISQISDLSSGFGNALNTMTSNSVTKSIIRNMEMNGTLETRPARLKQKQDLEEEEEEEEDDDDDDEDDDDEEDEEEEEEEEEITEVKRASQPKKKSSSRRQKAPLSNGKLANGVTHVINGSNSRAALTSDSVCRPPLNGHHADPKSNHLASDSDSEVYCDSVDLLGQEEGADHDRSLEEDVLLATEDGQVVVHGPPQGVRCGGEEGEASGTSSQRRGLNVDMAGRSLVRRGRGSRSPGSGSGSLMHSHSGGDGDGGRQGGAGTPSESLNEQIVVALARLQEDMQSVLERMHTLEALTASQARSVALSPTCVSPSVTKRSQKPSWWPFDISPSSLAFALVWPFVVQWLIRLYFQRRRRRVN
ncbi:acyl-CoA-binding domain-containing protein 5A isoform X2 [Cololabis saira]|uniref:acyl-CoA-binding domain-containing protein 5A isoform X2 n=1 Tax=Cololabis saira TaxID=129043 RepID=UPI002AD21AFC|nr:acyl-CoA-binding domain-containing protein 5A isoform X2 [Cololabis saira]